MRLFSFMSRVISYGLYALLSFSSAPVHAVSAPNQPDSAQAECLFRWAEDQYPAHLRPSSPATQTSGGYIFRHYTASNVYLGISKSDSQLYFYAPNKSGSGTLQNLGVAAEWIERAGCTNPYSVVKTQWDDVGAAPLCDPKDPEQTCLETHPKAIRIDDELRFAFARTSFDSTTRTFTAELKPGATLDPRFEVGAFLYRGRKDRTPMLHRIDSLQQNGQMITMTMSRARTKDVFPRGRIRARLPLSDGAAASRALGASPRLTSVGIGPKDCSGLVFQKAIIAPGASGNVELDLSECRFRLTAWVDTVLVWDTGVLNVDQLEVTVGGSIDAALHSKLTLDLSGGYGESKRIWEGPEIPFTIAGIVVTINPSVYAGYDLSAKAKLESLQGFDLYDSVEVGFGYSDVKNWYSIDKRESSFSKYGPTVSFDGNVTAKAWVEPRLDLKAFGFVGGSISLQGFAEAKMTSTATTSGGNFSGTLCTSLDLGLTPRVGAVAELLGVQLFSEDVALKTFRTHIVKNQCSAYTGPAPSDCDLSSSCCNDGQCAPASDPTLEVKCEKGGKLTSGKYRYSCETKYPKNYCEAGNPLTEAVCDDKNILTVDSCVNNRCVNELRSGDVAMSTPTSSASITTQTPLCNAPECCFSNSDCADGNLVTDNVCQKPTALALPGVKGTCGLATKSKLF